MALPNKLTVAGEEVIVPKPSLPNKANPSDRQRIQALVSSYTDEVTSDIRSLPETLIVDGQEIDTNQTRTFMATGTGESGSWISDLEVLQMIARGGVHGELFLTDMLRQLPGWDWAIDGVNSQRKRLDSAGKATELQKQYVNKRGLMVVDVVASAARLYDQHVVPNILQVYENQTKDLSLRHLASNPPNFLPLRKSEAVTMAEVAMFLLTFMPPDGKSDEEAVAAFVRESRSDKTRDKGISIKGIGAVLYEYLRLLSGADTIKLDVRVKESLQRLGLPVWLFSEEGLYQVCKVLARDCGCSLAELDQALWHK